MKSAPDSLALYNRLSYELAWSLTKRYSTSFSLGMRLFDRSLRPHIAAIYAVVRVADEIVDSWHSLDQARELDVFEAATFDALARGYSSNPLLQAFQLTARKFNLDEALLKAFFTSMRLDLTETSYDAAGYKTYIYGSAEVVGLMCLAVFTGGDRTEYEGLVPGARALGSAFQKVNFLRDLGADHIALGRTYFPDVDLETFQVSDKRAIEADIRADFENAERAVKRLPRSSRLGVLLAFVYYRELLHKIERVSPAELRSKRIRVSGIHKFWLFLICLRAV